MELLLILIAAVVLWYVIARQPGKLDPEKKGLADIAKER